MEHIVLIGGRVLRVLLEHIALRGGIRCFQMVALILLQLIRCQVTVFTDQLMDARFGLFPA